jgi:hypothetical protein
MSPVLVISMAAVRHSAREAGYTVQLAWRFSPSATRAKASTGNSTPPMVASRASLASSPAPEATGAYSSAPASASLEPLANSPSSSTGPIDGFDSFETSSSSIARGWHTV